MPLAVLLIANETGAARVLGVPAIEVQLNRARAAGAAHAVVFAREIDTALMSTIDTLRRDGLSVDIARSVADAAEYVHPDEAILIIAADTLLSHDRLVEIARSADPTVLCVRDDVVNERFERIDATARWTGFARIDGNLLRRTAAMVGDWDLGSTLMRRAVQDGAARIMLTPESSNADLFSVAELMTMSTVRHLFVGSVDADGGAGAGGVTTALRKPAARFLLRAAGQVGFGASWLTLGGLGVCGVAAICGLAGWIVISLIALLTAQLCLDAGDVGTALGLATKRWERLRRPTFATTASLVGIAMGVTLTLRSGQWGCLVLALVLVGAAWLAAPIMKADRAIASRCVEPAGHAVIGLIGFSVGMPIAGLAVAAMCSVGSLAWAVRKALAGLARF